MSAKTKDKEIDVFEDEVKEVEDIEQDDLTDLEEGLQAESDPKSRVNSLLDAHDAAAQDIVSESLDTQLTKLGRETGEKLNKLPKLKVLIPIKDLNPHDEFVVVATNGWISQIKRNVPVLLPDEIVMRLSAAGENPTLVR